MVEWGREWGLEWCGEWDGEWGGYGGEWGGRGVGLGIGWLWGRLSDLKYYPNDRCAIGRVLFINLLFGC